MLQRFRIDDPALLDQIAARLAAALDRLGRDARGLLSVTLAVPEISFDKAPGVSPELFLWRRPAVRHSLLGSGAAVSAEAAGPARWQRLRDAFSAWRADWRHADEDRTGLLPLALGGFAFAPEGGGAGFPAARLTVPALLLRRQGDTAALTFSFAAGAVRLDQARERLGRLAETLATPSGPAPELPVLTRFAADPEDAVWLARVRKAVADIQSGRLDKVVLSRRVSVKAGEALDPSRIVAELARRYPRCTLFAVPAEGGGMLLGASPEMLVGLRHGEAYSDALAGTAWGAERESGALDSVKNGREHRLVVQALAEGLRPLCSRLEVPLAPAACQIGKLHHLRSTLRGRVKSGVGLLDLAERLHPTPALGGYPRAPALDWMARHGEGRDGWYGGATGWIDSAGEGEFAVALRCALIQGSLVNVYAGAGIVAGSDAEQELAETEAKLSAVLDAMGREGKAA